MVKTYNNGMKNTDLMDQLKASYEVDCRYPKKFYLRVFFDLMDIGYVNAFIVCTKYMQDKFFLSGRLKTLKDFKHNVVMNLIGKFSSKKQAEFFNCGFKISLRRFPYSSSYMSSLS